MEIIQFNPHKKLTFTAETEFTTPYKNQYAFLIPIEKGYRCSKCGVIFRFWNNNVAHYCPMCGAKGQSPLKEFS